MTLMEALEKDLQKEIDNNEKPKDEEQVNAQELYAQLLDKKMKEMEKMFNDKMNNLIDSMQKKNDTNGVVDDTTQEGEQNDSTTDVPTT